MQKPDTDELGARETFGAFAEKQAGASLNVASTGKSKVSPQDRAEPAKNQVRLSPPRPNVSKG